MPPSAPSGSPAHGWHLRSKPRPNHPNEDPHPHPPPVSTPIESSPTGIQPTDSTKFAHPQTIRVLTCVQPPPPSQQGVLPLPLKRAPAPFPCSFPSRVSEPLTPTTLPTLQPSQASLLASILPARRGPHQPAEARKTCTRFVQLPTQVGRVCSGNGSPAIVHKRPWPTEDRRCRWGGMRSASHVTANICSLRVCVRVCVCV